MKRPTRFVFLRPYFNKVAVTKSFEKSSRFITDAVKWNAILHRECISQSQIPKLDFESQKKKDQLKLFICKELA